MGCIDLESGENVLLDIEFPVSFAVSDNGVTVYAYNSEGGYYFADLAKSDNKRFTNKLGSITNFEFFKESGEFAIDVV